MKQASANECDLVDLGIRAERTGIGPLDVDRRLGPAALKEAEHLPGPYAHREVVCRARIDVFSIDGVDENHCAIASGLRRIG